LQVRIHVLHNSKDTDVQQRMCNIPRSKNCTSNYERHYLRASWVPTSGHTMGEMRHPATLGCQRGQKAAPERLSEVGLSTVQSTSLHTAAAPFSSPFAFALLDEQWCTLGPVHRHCCTTAGLRTLLTGRPRNCKMWHLAAMTGASSSIVHAARGCRGHYRDKCIHTITTTICCLQIPQVSVCIDSKTAAYILLNLIACST